MGKAWTFGENMNTDEIIPGRYNITIDPLELAKNVFCEVKPEYAKNVRPGDVIVGGQNFGCGSSREHAPIAIKGLGVACVVAASFARIFYRNSFNIGLPIIESPEASREVRTGDEIEVDLAAGVVRNHTAGAIYAAARVPEFMQRLLEAGGIVGYVRAQLGTHT